MESYSDTIKSIDRVKEFAEVFTPPNTVSDMLNLIPKNNFGIHTTFLEPSCGNGNFIVQILELKFELCKTKHDVLYSIGTVYGIDIQSDNINECKNRIKKMMRKSEKNIVADTYSMNKDLVHAILDLNIVEGDFLSLDKKDIIFVDWDFQKGSKQISLSSLFKKEEIESPTANKTSKKKKADPLPGFL